MYPIEKPKMNIKNVIIAFLILSIFLSIYHIYYINNHYKMKPKSHSELLIIENRYKYEYKDYCRYQELVSKEFNTYHTLTISSKGWDENEFGKCIVLFRKVILRNYQQYLTDVKAYSHELAHIKYQTNNDTFVTYKAITTLYESENQFLNFVAIEYANDVLSGGYQNTDYDCSYYLYKYFWGKEKFIKI